MRTQKPETEATESKPT
ncbi:hypothetical protein VTH06DRAFT_4049 [Thermothelomyces fergusii]